jgi:hypothetical protein
MLEIMAIKNETRGEPLSPEELAWEQTVKYWMHSDPDHFLSQWMERPAADNLPGPRDILPAWENDPQELRRLLLWAEAFLPTPDWYQPGMSEEDMFEAATDWLNSQTT